MDEVVEKIRSFNRFYMPAMNLLGDHYLGSEYSVTQARIFFELYENEGCTAAHIAQTMNIDKSYLSRIIRSHEKNGYVRREKSSSDGRAMQLYLTEKGQKRAEEFIRKSNEEIEVITRDLSDDDKEKLSDALDAIMTILRKGSEKQ
jgi:DNA-binding MarR family transcriptional regulator